MGPACNGPRTINNNKTMKEQVIKKETEKSESVYVSADGLEFTEKGECQNYEENLFRVLKERVRRMAIKDTDAPNVFDGEGCDEHDAFVIIPKDSEQVETIRTLVSIYAYSPDKLCENVHVGRPIVLLFNYDNSYAWVTDLDEMIRTATNGLFKVAPVE